MCRVCGNYDGVRIATIFFFNECLPQPNAFWSDVFCKPILLKNVPSSYFLRMFNKARILGARLTAYRCTNFTWVFPSSYFLRMFNKARILGARLTAYRCTNFTCPSERHLMTCSSYLEFCFLVLCAIYKTPIYL